nr:MAG TPA: hypothetical protein [Caudoviricetes sp.]
MILTIKFVVSVLLISSSELVGKTGIMNQIQNIGYLTHKQQ